MSRRYTARAADTDQTRVMDQTPLSMGQPCPDDLGTDAEVWIAKQHAALLAEGRPVSKRYLRAELWRRWQRELAQEDPSAVLTMHTRRGSVPVDRAVGERVAAKLTA